MILPWLPMMNNHLDRDGAPPGAPWAAITQQFVFPEATMGHTLHTRHTLSHACPLP